MNKDSFNVKLNKLRGLFTKSQKEIISSEGGTRNLYFDYNRKYFIKFSLDVKTTCESIYKIHKDNIIKKVYHIYGDDINLENFAFFIVQLNANKYDGTQNLINLKLRIDDNNINRMLMNSQLMICYFMINKQNILYKKSTRILSMFNPINFEKMDIEEKKENKNSQNIKTYLSKTTIYYYNYNAFAFSKEKIIITEKEIFISSSPNYKLLIKDIKSTATFISTDEKDEKRFTKDFKIYGDKPIFCLIVEPNLDKKLLIGRNTYENFMTLYKALESAINNYQNYFCHFSYNNKIFQYHMNLFLLSNDILKSSSSIDDLVINKEKRKILFKDFKETDLVDIVDNIMEFKINFNKKKYEDSINNIRNLMDILDKVLKETKYEDVINEENIGYIKNIWNKINEMDLFVDENNEFNNNEINNTNDNTISPDKENISPDETNQNNKQNNIEDINDIVDELPKDCDKIIKKLSEEQIEELHNIINVYSFDSLYSEIKQKYISQFYEQKINSKKENNINRDLKLILGNYISNNLEMKGENDVVYLGGDELDKTIKDFNDKLKIEKEQDFKVY